MSPSRVLKNDCTVGAVTRQTAATQRVAGSTNCCFWFGCHVYVNLYVCKLIHDIGENPSIGTFKKVKKEDPSIIRRNKL
uniref:SFRICE_027056 n=1 Tax=Spodoptera frugiperda TaxID=7108 RepID=A0A2H1V2L4_SPOFR